MASGYLTDEELELCQTIEQPLSSAASTNVKTNNSSDNEPHMNNTTTPNIPTPHNNSLNTASTVPYNTPATIADSLTSPSIKEVLIGGDNNPSRR